MPAKGVGEHGGVAKWRHGWIPVNAAARAIVARRKARALGRLTSEESSSVTADDDYRAMVNGQMSYREFVRRHPDYTPPIKVPRRRRTPLPEPSRFEVRPSRRYADRWEIIDNERDGQRDSDDLTREQADGIAERSNALSKRLDAEGAGLHIERGGGRWHVLNADDKLVKTFKSREAAYGYVASRQPGYVKPKRAKPTFPIFNPAGVEKIVGEHTAEDDAINTNPTWIQARATEDDRYTQNCALAVQAWEMRRRGYAVEAGPMPSFVDGMAPKEIAAGWKYPESGATARFSYEQPGPMGLFAPADPDARRARVEKAAKSWPVGARGFIACVWRSGAGGHVFAVEKQADGLHYYDPQPGVELTGEDLQRYFAHMAVVATLRVDDKVPASDVALAVRPGRTEGAPFRPGQEVMDEVPTPEGLAALDKQIAWNKKAGEMAAANGRKEDAQTAKTLAQAYKDARSFSPNQILTLLHNNTEDYMAMRVSPDVYSERRDGLREALSLQHPGLKSYAEVEDALAADQGVPGDLHSALLGSLPGNVVPRIQGPHDWRADMVGANPHFDHITPMGAANTPYRQNCVGAVAAYDLRRRGFDVTAAPNDSPTGNSMGDLTINYRTADGHVPTLVPYSINEIHREVDAWPEGAWGMADGANHLFIIQKVNGEIQYIDPQSGTVQQTGNDAMLPYWYRPNFSEKDRVFLRLDDLTPVPGLNPLVEKGPYVKEKPPAPPPLSGWKEILGADLPTIPGEHSMEFDTAVTNPLFDSGDDAYVNNCVHCVQAWELRRRGLDVTASGLPGEFGTGRSAADALGNWKGDPQRRLVLTNPKKADNVVSTWPPGARGWAVIWWNKGGSHIFAVEKGKDGKVTWVDPQAGRTLRDLSEYTSRAQDRIDLVRVDDLQPDPEEVAQFINPVTPQSNPVVLAAMKDARKKKDTHAKFAAIYGEDALTHA